MRINARLDEQSSEMLAYLRQQTQEHTTDVIKRALALYYQQVKGQSAHSAQQLINSPFIGCGATDTGLSSNYKTLLTDSLAKKHGASAVHDANDPQS